MTATPANLSKFVTVRVTAEERARLEVEARQAGLGLSDFVRSRIIRGARAGVRRSLNRAAAPETFRAMSPALFAELSRIGNNINQIARLANVGRDPRREDAFDLLREAWAILLQDEVTARYAHMAEAKRHPKAALR